MIECVLQDVNINTLLCQMNYHSIVLSHILLKFAITSCKQMYKMDMDSSPEMVASAERKVYLYIFIIILS